jgi:hypothetical protein
VNLLREKRYWMRVYDENFERRIEEYYAKNKKQFSSQNDFLKTCCDYGLTMLEKSNKLSVEEFLKNKDFGIGQKLIQEMLSDIYKILEAFNSDEKFNEEGIKKMSGLPIKFWLLKRKLEKGGD